MRKKVEDPEKTALELAFLELEVGPMSILSERAKDHLKTLFLRVNNDAYDRGKKEGHNK